MFVWQEKIQIVRESICIFALLLIIISYVRSINTETQKNRLVQLFNLLILMTLLMYLGQLIFALLSMFFTEWICINVIPITPPWYFIAKGVYYSVFILRLRIIFGDASMAYHKKKLIALLIFEITFAVIMAIWAVSEQIFFNQYIYYDAQDEYCYAGIPVYIVVIFAIWDLSMSFLLLYLFISKLKKLVVNLANAAEDITLQTIMLKSTVLAVTAIISTFIFLVGDQIIAPKDIDGWIYIDLVVNGVCIIFMKKSFDRYYKVLCHYPHKCVICCCAKKFAIFEKKIIATEPQNNIQELTVTQNTAE